MSTENEDEWTSIVGPFNDVDIRALRQLGAIDQLSLTNHDLVTEEITKGCQDLESVRRIWLWCNSSRSAIKHVVTIPDLEDLSILGLCAPGSLEAFDQALNLTSFGCDFMTADDLEEVLHTPELKCLRAHDVSLTDSLVTTIVEHNSISELDIEASNATDRTVAILAQSSSLKKLDVGSTSLTGIGLKAIVSMNQLKELDIWATQIQAHDLNSLEALIHLEYLSVGGREGQTELTAENVIPKLKRLPSLKRLWIHGIPLTETELAELREQYTVSYTE